MKALVVGYGSIGARHARLLTELGCQVAVVSGRTVDFPQVYRNIPDAIQKQNPEYVVIANATSQHLEALSMLATLGYTGTALVEKPLFDQYQELPKLPFRDAYVGYNLRFHPVIQKLKRLIEGEQILSATAYVGQYLPEWRPGTDYRKSYSAHAEQGGGVLRDLSHELDYITWLLGGWERVTAIGGHFSPLEISSDDIFSLMLVTRACPAVTLQLNYLDRYTRRFIILNTTKHTIEADLKNGVIRMDKETETFATERDQTYRSMHEALLSGKTSHLCSIDAGLDTMRLIGSAELASSQGKWVAR